MKGSTIILFVLTITAASAELISVTNSNYEEVVLEADYTFLMFYHKSNLVSKKLLPKFLRMSKNYPKVNFATIEASKQSTLADKYLDFDYPSFILYISGIRIKSEEHESIIKLKSWLTKKLSIKLDTISDESQFGKNDLKVFVSGSDESQIVNILTGLKIKYQETSIYRINASFATTLATKYNLDLKPNKCVFIHRKHDEYSDVYKKELVGSKLDIWLLGKEFPDYSYFSDMTIHWFEVQKIPLMIFFHDPSLVEEEWIVSFKEASIGNKGVAISVLADVTKDNVKAFMKQHGFKISPSLILIESDKPCRKYLCRKKLTVFHKKLINRCAASFFSEKLPRFYKSEEASPKDEEGVLKTVVGNNFGKKVYNNNKDHLIVYFYNNETKALIEVIKEFANKVSKIEGLKCNIFNVAQNEHKTTVYIKPGTLIYYSPVSDSASLTKANFEVSDILNFLEENAPESIFSEIYSTFNGAQDL